jgi:DNA repair ATPase RecN
MRLERRKKMVDARFVDQARRDLTALLAAHPELEFDDVLCTDMIEGATNALELLDELIRAEQDARILAERIDVEVERLQKRQARFSHRCQLIRKYMMQLMDSAGLKKVERPAATISIAAGRSKVVITDEDALPEDCMRIKREPDKTRIASHLHRGDYIPGATLSNSEPVLRISR